MTPTIRHLPAPTHHTQRHHRVSSAGANTTSPVVIAPADGSRAAGGVTALGSYRGGVERVCRRARGRVD